MPPALEAVAPGITIDRQEINHPPLPTLPAPYDSRLLVLFVRDLEA
jgi:hypothetical protein